MKRVSSSLLCVVACVFMAGLPVLGSSVPEIRRIVEETAGGEVVDVRSMIN